MDVVVTPHDGVAVRNVKLGGRCMAASISVPYLELTIDGKPPLKVDLTPDTLQWDRAGITRPSSGHSPMRIVAVYAVDQPAGLPGGRLEVTLDYRFYRPLNTDCEPRHSMTCAWFVPRVAYELTAPDSKDRIAVSVAQRFDAALYSRSRNSWRNTAGLFLDNDFPRPTRAVFRSLWGNPRQLWSRFKPAVAFEAELNPVEMEMSAVAIGPGRPSRENKTGRWDNIHIAAEEDLIPDQRAKTMHVDAPGCPPCIHIHWRWGGLARFVSFYGWSKFSPDPKLGNKGQPVVPIHSDQTISDQTVEIFIVAGKPEESDPNRVANLIAVPEPLGGEIDFWYVGTSYRPSDAFFIHGGFFAPYGSREDHGRQATPCDPACGFSAGN